MARPQKVGLDYFALDVIMNDEVHLIEAEHGLIGFAILIKLLQTVYNEGYFYKWSEREQLLFSSKINTDRNVVASIVNDCIKWDIFNEELYAKYGILTSRRIQSHYIMATYKRVEIIIITEHLLIDKVDRENIKYISLSKYNKDTSVVTDDINKDTSVLTDIQSTHSIVKDSTVEDSIVISDLNKYLNILQRIKGFPYDDKIDTEYYLTLEERYPTLDLVKAIQNFSDFRLGKEYKAKANHRLQISNWFKNDVELYKRNLKPMPKIKDDNYFSQRG